MPRSGPSHRGHRVDIHRVLPASGGQQLSGHTCGFRRCRTAGRSMHEIGNSRHQPPVRRQHHFRTPKFVSPRFPTAPSRILKPLILTYEHAARRTFTTDVQVYRTVSLATMRQWHTVGATLNYVVFITLPPTVERENIFSSNSRAETTGKAERKSGHTRRTCFSASP
jgi:hypothetical protein